MKNVLVLLLICTGMAGFAQTKSMKNSPALSEAAAETVGMSSERLGRLDNIFQQSINNSEDQI